MKMTIGAGKLTRFVSVEQTNIISEVVRYDLHGIGRNAY